jgi:glyoxylase-like metal-dependent hydrolase (beta-lactamase superfamily II)
MERVSRFGFVNAYLVPEEDGLTLIDTTLPRSAKPILAAAERLGTPIRRGSYPGTKTRPTRTLQPGDRVGSLEVVAAPGHTPGQVAFLDTRDRTLFSGDAYSTLGGVATSAKVNPRFPLPTVATWHRPTALETARALRALDPARLAPGHGKVVEAPGAAMDAAIARGV